MTSMHALADFSKPEDQESLYKGNDYWPNTECIVKFLKNGMDEERGVNKISIAGENMCYLNNLFKAREELKMERLVEIRPQRNQPWRNV